MYSLPEILTENFYLWEYRGRGWATYDVPVELEPPYVPFSRIGAAVQKVVDDGKRPTLVSSLIEKVKAKFVSESATNGRLLLPEPANYDVLPEPYIGEPSLVEMKLVSPADSDVSILNVKHLLLDLSYLEHPLSFEIVGEDDHTIVQIVCAASEADLVQKEIKAYFPEVAIQAGRFDRGEVASIINRLDQSATSAAVVDFGLSEEFMRPVRTFKNFSLDPLTGIYAALEGLSKGEGGVYQVIFKAARSPWAESIMRSVTGYDGSPFFLDAPEMVPLAKEKTSSVLYATVVRVMGLAKSESRAREIARSLASPFRTFARPESNELIPLRDDDYPPPDHLEDAFMRSSRRTGMILNIEELAGLLHPPSSSVISEKLSRRTAKTRPAPQSAVSDGVRLGENIHQGKTTVVTLSPEERLKHIHVIGATGTGKSTLLLNLIIQDMKRGGGLALLDPHGDLVESALGHVPEERFEDVIVIDPSDSEYPVGFNILSAKSEIEKTVLSSDLTAIFKRFATSWGDQMTTVLGNAVAVFVESRLGGTLSDLRRFLIERDFRNQFLKTVDDPDLRYFWENEFHLLHGTPQASILTRLDSFLRPKLVRYIVNQKDGLDFGDIINGRKILLIKLAQGLIGEENSYLLGALIVSKMHQVVMARQALSQEAREDFYFYIDEFQNFITPSLANVLSSSRKYHLGLVLAHQDLRQLYDQDKAVANSVISNAGTRVCFRLGEADAEKLSEGFSHFSSRDLQELSVGETLVRIDRADHDFNLRTYKEEKIDLGAKERAVREVTERSRKKYGRKPEVIKNVPTAEEETAAVALAAEEVIPQPITHEVIKERESPRKQAPPVRKPPEDESLSQHRYLQALIKRMAEQRGYKAVVEERTPDGRGRVDVGLERDGKRIAFEVSVTTDEVHELQNIRKCLAAGYDMVVMVSPNTKNLERIRSLSAENLADGELSKVTILQTERVLAFFEDGETVNANREETVKGYRVKVQYPSGSRTEANNKRQAVADVILRSVQRFKNNR